MFKLIKWILKRFWFPILLIILGRLGRTRPWAAKAHSFMAKIG